MTLVQPESGTQLDHVGHLRAQGYAHVPSLGVTADELAEARDLLDGLFARFDELPVDKAHDLGTGGSPGRPAVPEVLDCSTLEPRLRTSAVFRAAQRVAQDVLGDDVYPTYDHAIYKPAGLAGVTSWHQDAGFDLELDHGLAVWVPFQDTDVEDGCMRYVPRSHQAGRMEHLTRTGPGGKEVFHLEIDETTAVHVPCLAGGATMHDFYTVHGAGSNQGHTVRRAWVLDFSTAPRHRRLARRLKDTIRSRTGR